MTEDYIKIRKGTDPKTAFKKAVGVIWEYLWDNAKGFKTESTITITLSRVRE